MFSAGDARADAGGITGDIADAGESGSEVTKAGGESEIDLFIILFFLDPEHPTPRCSLCRRAHRNVAVDNT